VAVNVRLWELGEYRDHDKYYPALIDPDWINGQLTLTTVSIGENRVKVWATVDLARVRILNMMCYSRVDIFLQ
jgi:hypothetical protein